MGFTLISSTLSHDHTIETNIVQQAHAIERAAFTLRVSQMEAATLATSTTGEKNSVEGGQRDRRVFVCFSKVPRSI